ncbi:hypothetical protein CI102_14557 [Trichoderma harzianum]|uniref:Uncharacterized protein n=1 Tax=Trichoderma harzianum CBS 226.95 TaxID=983964 RepID=A0A2T4AP30_TRIHA|nr:hypothetical protein M431DRAFT_287628 [Trichoderma harzianum CBS 226.95]PKK41080.1 hypothetical protein CI102_14557 [Trichoderma harzianum]PTB58832.1 hypothetical protein M431DRAFT_287628 [Trichoderma harzianum CBS 226.95]
MGFFFTPPCRWIAGLTVSTLFCRRLFFMPCPPTRTLSKSLLLSMLLCTATCATNLIVLRAKVHALCNFCFHARINWAKKEDVTEPPRACGAGNPETGAGVATTQAVRRDQGGFESGLQVGLAMKPRH